MINHIVDVIVKPGRAVDFCRAIQDNLSIWKAQPGFVDEIVLVEPEADHVVAQSFWTTVEAADRFNAEVFPRITAIVKDIMAAPPKSVTYEVGVSTNRNIVPEGELAQLVDRHPPAQAQNDNLAAQAMKLPPAIFVSGLELFLQLSRGAQNVYSGAIDGALGITTEVSQTEFPAVAQPLSSPVEKDIVRDTFNGLIAFVVPGPDAYSVSQGESSPQPGGCDAGILDALIRTIDSSQPAATPNGSPATVVASVLNHIAQKINPSAQGPFPSPFARLSFPQKAAVFQSIEADPQTRPLAGVLPITAFLVYSEAGVYDPRRRTLSAQPLGWDLSNYEGVADGRDELKGYFQDRRSVDTDPAMAGP